MSNLSDEDGFNGMKIEAENVVKEIAYAVSHAELSNVLHSTDNCVYINISTKENNSYCIELSLLGFKIVGHDFDRISESLGSSLHYETIYSLLDNLSPHYRLSFGETLAEKLKKLQEELKSTSSEIYDSGEDFKIMNQ